MNILNKDQAHLQNINGRGNRKKVSHFILFVRRSVHNEHFDVKITVRKALFEEDKLCNFITTLYLRCGKVKGKIHKLLFLTQIKGFFTKKGFGRFNEQSFYLHFAVYFPAFPIAFPLKSFPYALHKVKRTLKQQMCISLPLPFASISQ